MKPTKEAPQKHKEKHDLLKKAFGDNICAVFITTFGMADLMKDFILEKVNKFIDIPIQVKYAIIQHMTLYSVLVKILNGEFQEEEVKFLHMPNDEGAWQSGEDFEKRFIFVVKSFYEDLKKNGKI